MPWFMTPYGPQHVIEPGTIDEFERRDYVALTAQQAADYFAGVAFPDPPSFATEAEVPGIMATVAADAGSAFSVAQRAAFGSVASITPEAFNLPLSTNGATVNPTLVMGVDPVTGILFGIDRPSDGISMSANGSTWQTNRGKPANVNHVQLHKIIRFGAHIYLFAISGIDGRPGIYRAPAPTAATDTITWDVLRTNLITNPSFASGQTGWTGRGTIALTVPTDGGFSGTQYARITATGDGGVAVDSNTFAVTAGQSFAFSAYVRGTPGQTVQVSALWTGATQTGPGYVAVASNTQWQRITFTGTVPAGATAVAVRIGTSSSTVTGNVLDVDAALAELGTQTVKSYIDTTDGRYALMTASTSASGANFEALNGKSTCFAAGTSALMLGDYGDFAAGPSIQRSLDGTTWTTVWGPVATSRHVHGVAEDPYHPGHWYATIGDGATNTAGVIRSTDNGDTWQTIVTGSGGNLWQAVQISFSEKYVYLAGDHYGASAFYFERGDNPTVRHLTFGSHWHMPVPGGVGGRIITDLATTAGSAAVTSASFTAQDRGRVIQADTVPLFAAVSDQAEPNWLTGAGAGTATLRRAATATATGQTAFISGDRFFVGSYIGAVDPDSDIFYFAAMDTSSAGNTPAIFCVPRPGSQPVLLGVLNSPPTHWNAVWEAFVHDGWVYIGTRRFPAIGA